MSGLFFDFYGVHLRVIAEDPQFDPLLNWLRDDFSYFVREDEVPVPVSHQIVLQSKSRLSAETKNEWRNKASLFTTRLGVARGLFQRVCEFDDQHWLDSTCIQKRVIFGDNDDLTYEILNFLLLSMVGELLEAKGFLRLHALGISYRKRNYVFHLPSGAGKSFAAAAMQQRAEFSVFSDELVLTDGLQFFAFPMRIKVSAATCSLLNLKNLRRYPRRNLEDKFALPIRDSRGDLLSSASSLFFGKIKSSASESVQIFGRASALDKLHFFIVVFLGLGVPQMREFYIRGDSLLRLPLVSFRRSRTIFRLLANHRLGRLEIPPAPYPISQFIDEIEREGALV